MKYSHIGGYRLHCGCRDDHLHNESKVVHASIHKMTRTSATIEADVAKLNLVHKCESRAPVTSPNHMPRLCNGGSTQRSRVCSSTNKAVKSSKRHAAEAFLDKVVIGSSLIHLWIDHRLSRTTKTACARLSPTAARPGPSLEPERSNCNIIARDGRSGYRRRTPLEMRFHVIYSHRQKTTL